MIFRVCGRCFFMEDHKGTREGRRSCDKSDQLVRLHENHKHKRVGGRISDWPSSPRLQYAPHSGALFLCRFFVFTWKKKHKNTSENTRKPSQMKTHNNQRWSWCCRSMWRFVDKLWVSVCPWTHLGGAPLVRLGVVGGVGAGPERPVAGVGEAAACRAVTGRRLCRGEQAGALQPCRHHTTPRSHSPAHITSPLHHHYIITTPACTCTQAHLTAWELRVSLSTTNCNFNQETQRGTEKNIREHSLVSFICFLLQTITCRADQRCKRFIIYPKM